MKLKLLFPILLFFTTFFRLYGQAADDWHRVVLPEEVPYRIGKVCDFWVCQTNGGYFYKQESDTMWTKVNTDNLPLGGGNSMLWHSNKMGVMLQYDSTTAGGVGADYWRSIFWAFNCDTKKFVQKFDFNCYSVEHSGGIGAGLRSINNDSIWLLTRGEWQYMGGSGLICDAYRSYTGGESWSGVSCSYGTTWHSDTLVSILNDTIWINPAGPQPQAPAMPQPFNGYGAYIAYSDGAILVMRYSTADTAFISYKTTDWGMNWETDTIIFTPPSTVGYFAPQLTTASGCFIFSYGDSEYVHKISGSVWSSLYSEKLGPSNVLWIKSLPFWIRNTKGQLLRSFDYGSTWEEVSTKGLNPALNGSVYYNGEYPIAQVRGLAYKILPDHTIEKLDSFGRSVTQPNLHWEWNDKEWVLVDKTVIYQTPTGWDTLGEFFPMPGIHVFTDEGRRYIVKDKGPVNVLYSDVTGNNWSNTILNGKIHFIPYHNRWFAVTDLKKVYISDDFGST